MIPDDVLAWAVPALIVFASAAIAVLALAWAIRLVRRSPRARTAAARERSAAGSSLVALDDAVADLDIEVALSGALYDASAPPALRHARMSAQHVRDDAFEAFAELGPDTHPAQVTRVSRLVRTHADAELAAIDAARVEHAVWLSEHAGAAAQVAAARQHCHDLRARVGDPGALLADLAARFDEDQWQDAARAAATLRRSLAEADGLLDAAAARTEDPTRAALPLVADAERRIRTADAAAHALEEHHRALIEASVTVGGEIEAARTALRQAMAARAATPAAGAERLGDELREIEASLAAAEDDALRRPAAAATAVARARDRIDLALGDARTARDRLAGARSALPGALSVARAAIAHAEPDVRTAGADARVRLAAAQRELAAARDADDPVMALDAARRAARHADDAAALAAYDGLTRS